jgi:hypothetical protein
MNKLNINEKYLNYDIETFNANRTIIIKSGTGTGKTTNTSRQLKQYLIEHPDMKVLSIVNYISISKQQQKTFKEDGIILNDYSNVTEIDINDKHYVVCLNSLSKLIENVNYDKTILYIDEVSSLIKSLVENDLLNRNVKRLFLILMDLIKNCHKVVVSDANVADNVFNLLQKRDGSKIFINNLFKKFNGINAKRCKNEYNFINKMKTDIEKLLYFLCGADSCETITRLYNECIKEYQDDPEMLSKFILITSKTKFDIKDASEQFKDKFVFYSPSIVTGFDFSINVQHKQYLYIKGKSLNVLDNFQQATRTRNMSELVYFIKPQKNLINWNLLKDIESLNKNLRTTSDKILNICSAVNEDNECCIIENSFFKLATWNDYLNGVVQCDNKFYFEKLLTTNGFNLIDEKDEVKQLSKEDVKEQKMIIVENENKCFEQFIQNTGLKMI